MQIVPKEYGDSSQSYGNFENVSVPNSRNHRNKSHGHNFNQGGGLESEGTGNNS
jgi:hypothetical protein